MCRVPIDHYNMSVQISMFIGDLFLNQLSDVVLPWLSSESKVEYSAGASVFIRTQVFRSLYVLRVNKDHCNECIK